MCPYPDDTLSLYDIPYDWVMLYHATQGEFYVYYSDDNGYDFKLVPKSHCDMEAEHLCLMLRPEYVINWWNKYHHTNFIEWEEWSDYYDNLFVIPVDGKMTLRERNTLWNLSKLPPLNWDLACELRHFDF